MPNRFSILDIFKIGIGPSSSHTVGPMVIARRFLSELEAGGLLRRVAALDVELHGSLALTGEGHGTDRAVVLGLMGLEPRTALPETCDRLLEAWRAEGVLDLPGGHRLPFRQADIRFDGQTLLEQHPNSMRLTARDAAGQELLSETHLSLGGGFTCRLDEFGEGDQKARQQVRVRHAFSSAAELLASAARAGLSIGELVLENEDCLRPREQTLAALDEIWEAMRRCIERGLASDGVLPGRLGVRRRARELYQEVSARGAGKQEAVFDWLNAYAMAVNEENAAGGRVVTAPTNGAAGIVPAVIQHYCAGRVDGRQRIRTFLLTAGAIGILYKARASISGAEMGCQGEVGVACSMAAGGLAASWGGSNEVIEHAAEIGMEHNLGLTCDPVAGLVQIPCIERNAIGAVKAVNAARLSMASTGPHRVTLDQVIETMRQTGLDMHHRYKETSLGGLAVNVVEC